MASGMRGLIGLAMMLVLALAMLGSAAMAGLATHPSRLAARAPLDEAELQFSTHTQAFEDGFLGGAGRGGIADDADFARPIVELGFEAANTVMALGEDERVDTFEDDRLAARGVLHVDGAARRRRRGGHRGSLRRRACAACRPIGRAHTRECVSPACSAFTHRRTRQPSRASFSARPMPIQSARQSAMTTEAPTLASPLKTDQASTQCISSLPSNCGRCGSGTGGDRPRHRASSRSTRARSTARIALDRDAGLFHSRARLVTMPPNSARPGTSWAISAWPPRRGDRFAERDLVAALRRGPPPPSCRRDRRRRRARSWDAARARSVP